MSDAENNALVAQIFGAISAQQFALEHLWAAVIEKRGGDADDARILGLEMLRQFEDFPPTNSEGSNREAVYAITQHGVHHLERLWIAVEARLRGAAR